MATMPVELGDLAGGGGASIQDLRDWLNTLPPDEAERWRSVLGIDYEGEQGVLDKQFEQAEALRGEYANPEMRSNSRIMVAANPLEFAGAGLQRYQARQQQRQAMDEMRGLARDRSRALRGLMDFRLGRGARPPIPRTGTPY